MKAYKRLARALSRQSLPQASFGLAAAALSLLSQPAIAQESSVIQLHLETQAPIILDYQDSYIRYHETPPLETILRIVEPQRLDDPSYAIIAERYVPEARSTEFLESIIDTAQTVYEPYLSEPNGTSDFFSYLFELRQEIAQLPDAQRQLGFDLQEDTLLYTRDDHLRFYQSLDEYLNEHGFFLNIITAPLADGRSGLSVYLGEMVYEKTEIIETLRNVVVADTRFVRNLDIQGYYLSNDARLSTTGWTDFFKNRIYIHLDDIAGQEFTELDEFRRFRNHHEAEHIAQYTRQDRGNLYTLEGGAITANLVLTPTLQHDINRIYHAYYDRRGFTTEPYRTIYEEIIQTIETELGYTRQDIRDGSYSQERIRGLAQTMYDQFQ